MLVPSYKHGTIVCCFRWGFRTRPSKATNVAPGNSSGSRPKSGQHERSFDTGDCDKLH